MIRWRKILAGAREAVNLGSGRRPGRRGTVRKRSGPAPGGDRPAHWSGKRESNPRLQPWQGCTLPLSYSRSRPGAPGATCDLTERFARLSRRRDVEGVPDQPDAEGARGPLHHLDDVEPAGDVADAEARQIERGGPDDPGALSAIDCLGGPPAAKRRARLHFDE